ncbi:hypothetical protein [Pseudoponticoccus marisrubri]|uniref:Uncharacterized protein n=1 Tax=Pseudoponticoccus marisrubri TaxID=1685382 RepID=A0A0W7WFK1_9RHOB|nr:hypothetical protein [Pseudoponticoccus marisrubri]KUF09240.1 hypothetical protein AVJ23_18470 [Pseudoponticoccus marisrubri]
MDDALRNFQKRQQAVHRKHLRMARGYVTKLDRTGVFVQTPDNKAAGFGLRTLLLVVLAFALFKIGVLAYLGEEVYAGHVEALRAGSVFEQAGAWLMQADPVTRAAASLVAPYLG